MRSRTLASWTACAIVATLATACSGDKTTPTPSSPAPTSQTSASSAGAPQVPKALDTKAIEADPCSAVTPDEIATLGAPQKSATVNSDALGPGCGWLFSGAIGSVSGSVLTSDKSGLNGLYAKQQQGGFTEFEPFTAAGYPGAVFANTTVIDPGHCSLAIGLRDDLTYSISVSQRSSHPNYKNPCDTGKKLAGFVVEHLLKGQQ